MANANAHRWNRTETEYLTSLRQRFAVHNGRGRGRGGRNLSERQYVIARFRAQFIAFSGSDQSIWAKYVRVNGLKGIAPQVRREVARAVAALRIESIFRGDKVVLTPGMTMKQWSDLGLDYIGAGATRSIYDLGNAVLKVAKKADGRFDGRASNTREARTFAKVGATPDAVHFAAVLAADPDGNWLVMEKVEPNKNWNNTPDVLREAASRHNVHDVHAGNYGYKNGQPVLLDYASA